MDYLSWFCSPKYPKYPVPFLKGDGNVYATDGSVLIRRPQTDKDQFDMGGPDLAGLEFSANNRKRVDIPDIPWTHCFMCDDEGCVYECPECNGEGALVFASSVHSYVCKCKTCMGDGWSAGPKTDDTKMTCPECNGTMEVVEYEPFDFGGYFLSARYVRLVGRLPGAKLYIPTDTQDPFFIPPAYFTFNNGDGLINPMRPKL